MQLPLSRAVGATLILSVAAIGACSDNDDDLVGPQEITSQVINSIQNDSHIMGLLHETNGGEIQVAQLAAQRATDAEVKAFSGMMVADHTTLDITGAALATRLGIMPTAPNTLLLSQQDREMSQLSLVTGTSFDRNYIAQQIVAHTRTLAIVDASIPKTSQPAIRTLLQEEVRVRVAAHLAKAQAIAARIGSP
jgi:predicted outer membrane protein